MCISLSSLPLSLMPMPPPHPVTQRVLSSCRGNPTWAHTEMTQGPLEAPLKILHDLALLFPWIGAETPDPGKRQYGLSRVCHRDWTPSQLGLYPPIIRERVRESSNGVPELGRRYCVPAHEPQHPAGEILAKGRRTLPRVPLLPPCALREQPATGSFQWSHCSCIGASCFLNLAPIPGALALGIRSGKGKE